MDGKKISGILLALIGLGITATSLLADYIVVGGRAGIGLFQIIGAVVGAVIAIIGALQFRK